MAGTREINENKILRYKTNSNIFDSPVTTNSTVTNNSSVTNNGTVLNTAANNFTFTTQFSGTVATTSTVAHSWTGGTTAGPMSVTTNANYGIILDGTDAALNKNAIKFQEGSPGVDIGYIGSNPSGTAFEVGTIANRSLDLYVNNAKVRILNSMGTFQYNGSNIVNTAAAGTLAGIAAGSRTINFAGGSLTATNVNTIAAGATDVLTLLSNKVGSFGLVTLDAMVTAGGSAPYISSVVWNAATSIVITIQNGGAAATGAAGSFRFNFMSMN